MANLTAPLTLPDRYRLEGPIAAGGMAAVYAAHDTLLDRRVAVKVLAEYLGADPAARERFAREARAAAGLSHRAVVTIFDVGEHDGRSFIVMELLSGGTLADVLRRDGRIEPERAVGWLRDIASALDLAHSRGIVHRDIKPGNLLLDDQDRVAVADFGIARLAWEDQVTATGQVLGTASYISPEQAQGHPATDASDRYALAVVAFELLTGTRPFTGEHFAAQARAHIEDPPPSASTLAPGLPPAVDRVLGRGLDKDPSARWETATGFVDALEGALASHDAAATTRRMAPTAVAAPAPPRRAPLEQRGSRNLLWAAVPIVLALLAIAVAAALSGGDDPSSTADRTPAATPTARAEGTPTAEPSAEATPTPAQTRAAGAAELNDRGFALFEQGNYAGAIPLLRQAVETCGDGGQLDPCGYALFNLGAALRRSGDAAAAIPVLEERLSRFGDNEEGHVQTELDAAYADAGLAQPGPGNGNGNGKGKGKGRDKDSGDD